jgi:hypothetical protein
VEYGAALEATGHDDWGVHTAAGAERAQPITAAGTDATAAFTRLVLVLLARDPEGDERVRAEHAALLAADPGFAITRSPYALRLPWGTEVAGGWIAEGAGDPPGGDPLAEIGAGAAAWRAALPGARGAVAPAPLGDPAAGYRAMAEAVTGDDAVARATREAAAALVTAADAAPTPQDALVAFVTDGLLARFAGAGLRARAAQALERQAFWPDPITEAHWRALRDDLDGARTTTEAELVAYHATACLAVESDWNLLLHGALIAPLLAAIAYDVEPDPRRARAVRGTIEAAHALTGLGPRAALEQPAVAGLVGRDAGAQGTEEGEAGYDLVTAVEGWSAATGEPAEAAALARMLDRIGAPEPRADPRPVGRWGGPDGERPPLHGSLP